MRDIQIDVVSALSAILPTHYELALTKNTNTPCISYQERNNTQLTEVLGASVGYSRITFTIKVWSNKVAELAEYAHLVDLAMRELGFKRTSSQDLHDINSTMIQRIMTYEIMVYEEF